MAANKTYTVNQESIESLTELWHDRANRLKWDCLFVLPGWLKTWWQTFGDGQTSYLCSIRSRGELSGIAPLMIRGQTAHLMGDTDVCDYLDVVVVPGKEITFFNALFDHLRQQGIRQLDLGSVRADSALYRHLSASVGGQHYSITCEMVDAAMMLELPSSWDAYLLQLTGKQRHEVRRKFRRLEETGRVNLDSFDDVSDVKREMETFLTLFKRNRADKASFMTQRMASFFQLLASEMATEQILKLFFLTLDETVTAAVMIFDYDDTFHLYNNGYDQRYLSLSVGLLSKLFTVKESIRQGKKKYDFLKGTEAYKQRLGGRQIPLYRCRVQFE